MNTNVDNNSEQEAADSVTATISSPFAAVHDATGDLHLREQARAIA
jgi:hypothetical protein